MPDTKWNSIDEFAASIKEKFPVYKDRDNADLARAMFEKYPQYVSQVQTSQPRKKSTYSSAPPSNVPFLRLAIPELEKSRDEAIAKGDVSTAKEKELFRSTGQGISDLVSDPGNLALGAASMIPGARLVMAPVLGALGLHGMAASGTNIKDIGQETAYATGLSQTPGKYTTPEAAQQYLQSAAMGVGSIAASGEKGATEPTAKLLDRIKKAYVASGQLKSGKPGTPYVKTAMQETGRVAGAVGGYSMGAEFSHPIIAAIVGGKLGKGAGTGAYETGRIILEAAPKALRSKAFEAYQDSLNRDLFLKSPATGAPGVGSGGPGGGAPPAVGPTPAPGGATAQAAGAGVGATTTAKQLTSGTTDVKPSELIKREKQFKEEAPDQPSVPMKDVAKLINDGIKKWGIGEVDKFSKGLMSQKPVPNTQERFVAWQNFVENGPVGDANKTGGPTSDIVDKVMGQIIQGGMTENDVEFFNLRDKLYDTLGETETNSLMDRHREQNMSRPERISEMQTLLSDLEKPKTPAFDNKEWAKALGKVGNLLKPTSRSKPIKLPDIGSGHDEAQYIGAFEALTKMLPKMLGSEGEVIANTLTKAVAEGNMPAQEALVHATAWINEVQRKAYQARSKKTK